MVMCDPSGVVTLAEIDVLPPRVPETDSRAFTEGMDGSEVSCRGRLLWRRQAHAAAPRKCFVSCCCTSTAATGTEEALVASTVDGCVLRVDGVASREAEASAGSNPDFATADRARVAWLQLRKRAHTTVSAVSYSAGLCVAFLGDAGGDVSVYDVSNLYGAKPVCPSEVGAAVAAPPLFVAACVHGVAEVTHLELVSPTLLVSGAQDGQLIEFDVVVVDHDCGHGAGVGIWGSSVSGVEARSRHSALEQGRPLAGGSAGVRLVKRGTTHPPLLRTVEHVGWIGRGGGVGGAGGGGGNSGGGDTSAGLWVAGRNSSGLAVQRHYGGPGWHSTRGTRRSVAEILQDGCTWRLEHDVAMRDDGGQSLFFRTGRIELKMCAARACRNDDCDDVATDGRHGFLRARAAHLLGASRWLARPIGGNSVPQPHVHKRCVVRHGCRWRESERACYGRRGQQVRALVSVAGASRAMLYLANSVLRRASLLRARRRCIVVEERRWPATPGYRRWPQHIALLGARAGWRCTLGGGVPHARW